MVKILCIIPARSGSKGIPHKNIMNFRGQPLMKWSIDQAHASKHKMRVIVSTDSMEYAKLAQSFGAETPFLRPPEISQDLSTDFDCFQHAVKWLKEMEDYTPDIIVQLRPTYPTRTVTVIDACIDTFLKNMDSFDSLRTVVPYEKSPYKMYRVVGGYLKPLFMHVDGKDEPHNMCRQALPHCYLHNGYVDIFKTDLLKLNTVSGYRIYPYIMNTEETYDIDTEKDIPN